ncbi:MAG: nucleotidyl transferase AbiEii/AbiGii toxin family protein [Bacillota bacterium]
MQRHLRVLAELVRTRFPLLRDFYLAGGTALALQVRHRISEDLDFFSVRPLRRLSPGRVRDGLRVFGEEARPLVLRPGQEDWLVRGVRVTFVACAFPPVYPLLDARRFDRSLAGLRVACPQEIGLMKAFALGRRARVRDYYDLYVLFSRGLADLGETVRRAAEKYRDGGEALFSPRLFLEQLAHPEDAAGDPEGELCVPEGVRVDLAEMGAFFRDLVARYSEAGGRRGCGFGG